MGSPIRARTDSPSRHVGVSSAGTAPNRARTEPGSPKKATPARNVESLKALAAGDPPRAIAPRGNSPTRRVKTLIPRAITRLPECDDDFLGEVELIRDQESNRSPPGREPPLSLEGETGELDDIFEEIPSSRQTPEKRRRLGPLAGTRLSEGYVTDSEEEGGVAEVPAGAGDPSQRQQLQRAAAAESKKTLTSLRDEASPETRAVMEYIGKFCKMISDGNAGFEIKV